MENNQVMIDVHQRRSVLGMLNATIQFIKKNYKALLKASLPGGLLYIVISILMPYFSESFSGVFVKMAFTGHLSLSSIPMGPLIGGIVLVLLILFSFCYINGAVISQLNLYPDHDLSTLTFNDYKPLLLKSMGRYAIFLVFFYVCMIVLGGAFLGSLSVSPWLMLAPFFLFCYITIPLSFSAMAYVAEGSKFIASVKRGFSLGSRYWGFTFGFFFLLLLLFIIVLVMASLPQIVMQIIAKLSYESTYMDGNPNTLPWFFQILMVLAKIISLIISYALSITSTVAAYIVFFNCVKRREDKLTYAAEQSSEL